MAATFNNSLAEKIYGFAETIFDGTFLTSMKDLINIDLETDYAAVWTLVTTAYNAILPVGAVLVSLYFLLELAEKVQTENFNYEHFIKTCVKLIIGLWIMQNLLDIVKNGLEFASAVYTEINGTITSSTATAGVLTYYETNLSAIKKGFMGTLAAISYFIELFFPWVIMYVCKLVIYVTVYGRAIELAARAIFSPIGMANIFEGGLNSSGYRYFKKFVAVALQGAVIMVIMAAMSAMQNVIFQGIAGAGGAIDASQAGIALLKQCILGVTTVTLILKAQSWANDIMGV